VKTSKTFKMAGLITLLLAAASTLNADDFTNTVWLTSGQGIRGYIVASHPATVEIQTKNGILVTNVEDLTPDQRLLLPPNVSAPYRKINILTNDIAKDISNVVNATNPAAPQNPVVNTDVHPPRQIEDELTSSETENNITLVEWKLKPIESEPHGNMIEIAWMVQIANESPERIIGKLNVYLYDKSGFQIQHFTSEASIPPGTTRAISGQDTVDKVVLKSAVNAKVTIDK